MTLHDVAKLPLNLSPWQVKEILGCSDNALAVLRQQHPDLVVRRCGKGKHVYSKTKALELAKIACE
jgi:hypothetical protein